MQINAAFLLYLSWRLVSGHSIWSVRQHALEGICVLLLMGVAL